MHKSMKKLYWDFIFYFIVAIIVLVPIVLCGNLPGLYQDALMPDYLAVQFFNPLEYQVTAEVSYPFLTQIYHGALSAYISYIAVLLCGGETSVMQHHLVFALLIVIDCIIVGAIFKRLNVNDNRRHLYVLLMACLSSLMTACFTQYYIELPGTVLLLMSILIMIDVYTSGERKNKFFWMFFLLGIAFFNYFNYIFFVPAFYVLMMHFDNKSKQWIYSTFMALAGFYCGSILYVLGFAKRFFRYHTSFWSDAGLGVRGIVLGLIFVGVILNSVALNHYARKKSKFSIALFTAMVVQMTIYAYMAITVMRGFSKLDAALEAASSNIFYKIFTSIALFFRTLTCNRIENVMYGQVLGVGEWLYLSVLILVLLIALLCKKSLFYKWFLIFGFILVIYIAVAVILSSGLHEQHFIPCIIVFYLTMCMGAENIYAVSDQVIAKRVISVIIVSMFCINLYEKSLFVFVTNTNGGVELYSPVINDIAYEANARYENGAKDIYVFPQWGMITGFDYLTRNKICFSMTDSNESISEYIEKGYTVNICVFDSSDGVEWKEKYSEVVSQNQLNESIHYYYNMRNEQDAIRIELSNTF